MAWKSVDFPTLARPTCVVQQTAVRNQSTLDKFHDMGARGDLLTMPLLRLLPGRPRRIFSSTTAFLGGILFVFDDWARLAM
jgi:hypothetical protein